MTRHDTLFLDPWTGISGDMLLAALLDTDRDGAWLEGELRAAIEALRLKGTAVEVARDVEWGVACTRVRVDDGGAAPLRHLADMEEIIEGSKLSAGVQERAVQAVRRLAQVEAAVHGCSVEQIHFHEVGAVDTLVDVVGAFALVEALGVERVFVGPIPVGGGTVQIAHGRMGVPAPATARLLKGYEIVGGPEPRELTTPTGALLVGQLEARGGALPPMKVERVGHGAGTMRLDGGPNVLRAVLGSATSVSLIAPVSSPHGDGEAQPGTDAVVELETNLDDVSPEIVGYTLRSVRAAGALDAWVVPAQMKKERPGVVLHTLVRPGNEAAAVSVLFQQTGTLGIRRRVVTRYVAARGVLQVDVLGHTVRVKWGRWTEAASTIAPEYEDCLAVAGETRLPLREIMQMATEEARRSLTRGRTAARMTAADEAVDPQAGA